MKWAEALKAMKQGRKIKSRLWGLLRPGENVYFYMNGSELMLHTDKGKDVSIKDVEYWELVLIGADACGWEVVEDEDVREESV